MMENKCNKTPNSVSSKNSNNNNNNKFQDHVYCSSETKNIRNVTNNMNNHHTSSGGGGNAGGGGGVVASGDVMALLKENKKLKTMLLLHLDLIQEQNDQLMGKDKELTALNDEADMLRARNLQLETQVEELQKQLQRQMKRAAAVPSVAAGERCTLQPPPLAKIQCKTEGKNSIDCSKTTGARTAAGAAVPAGIASNASKASSAMAANTAVKTLASNQIIGECNGKLISKIILHRVAVPGRRRHGDGGSDDVHSARSSSTSETTSEADDSTQKSRQDLDYEEEELDEEEDEDDDDDDDADDEDMVVEEVSSNATDDSNDGVNYRTTEHSKRKRQHQPTESSATLLPTVVGRGAKPRQTHHAASTAAQTLTSSATAITTAKTTNINGGGSVASKISMPLQVCITPPTPSRGKQMPLMMCHAPASHETDEESAGSCDSMIESEKLSPSPRSPSRRRHRSGDDANNSGSKDATNTRTSERKRSIHQGSNSTLHPTALGSHLHAKARRCAYITTPELYCTREWEDEEEFICDYEFIKEEANALHADTPNLEIPKWTEHELSVSYSIEGTEDLCDETFLKRHTKFETDEKRRKKWDVQQIREQRRIEKLKRRHCKDELQQASEPQPLLSFYPQPDAIQTICYINDLPVQAFGEIIPKLHQNDGTFSLPWMTENTTAATTTTATTTSTTTTTTTTASTSASAHCHQLRPAATTANASVPNAQNASSVAPTTSTAAGSSSAQVQQQLSNSTFVFLKKTRRQQSSSLTLATPTTATTRQRGVVATATAKSTTLTTTTNTSASPARQ